MAAVVEGGEQVAVVLPPGNSGDAERRSGPFGTALLGGYLFILGIVLMVLLIGIWPVIEAVTASPSPGRQRVSLLGGLISFSTSPDTCLLLLVVVASAIGSYVHAATSFADFVGNRSLTRSWLWWYLLRIFIGTALGLVFYFAIRGGILGQDAAADQINPYGIAALAALSGLFSKQATDKLKEVFDTLFRTAEGHGDDQRSDKLRDHADAMVSARTSSTLVLAEPANGSRGRDPAAEGGPPASQE